MLAGEAGILLGEPTAQGEVRWGTMGGGDSFSTADLYKDGRLATLELAITGQAFDLLITSGDMEKLLLRTRIFARMSPAGKVRAVRLHMDRGFIVGMCGDGGNDCGALRTAHVGIALSEAEASVVSPFTSHSKSVQSVVDLLREGRGSLATAFASYKFLIMYGQTFSVIKLVAYYFGAVIAPASLVTIDGVAVILLSYLITKAEPMPELRRERPTSSLLSMSTIFSVVGYHLVNVTVMVSCLHLATSSQDYKRFPASYSWSNRWWELSNNWEATVIFTTVFPQFITSALIFSFGAQFRRGLHHNVLLILAWVALFGLNSFLLLADSNPLSEVYHIASEDFNGDSSEYPVWKEYQADGGKTSPAMSFTLRLSMWGLTSVGLVLAMLWEFVFIIGPGKKVLFPRRGVTHPDLAP